MAKPPLLLGPWIPHVTQEGTGWKILGDICTFEEGWGISEIYMHEDLWEMVPRANPSPTLALPTFTPVTHPLSQA